jgi:hypothetical protein
MAVQACEGKGQGMAGLDFVLGTIPSRRVLAVPSSSVMRKVRAMQESLGIVDIKTSVRSLAAAM